MAQTSWTGQPPSISEDPMNSVLRRFLVTGFMAALAFLLSACTAHDKPSKVETALATMAKDIVIPMEAEDLKNPLPGDQQVISEGRQVYLQSCAICHGADGRGQTTLGQGMYPPVMDLTSPHVQHWNDSEMFWIIQNGVRLTGMASWKGAINPDDTWKLVIFIHHLRELNITVGENATNPAPPQKNQEQLIAYGKTLYRQEGCFTCHQLNGEGTKVGPDLTIEGTRGRSADWLIGHFKNPAAYVPGSIMPSFTNLTDEQLSALTAFLRSQKGGAK
jgi:mono/diheme cytochrome c family protein